MAAATVIYVGLVAWLMTNAEKIIGETKTFLGPIAFLLLFVLSAAVTGGLILGKPVMLYIDGKRTEAIQWFILTLSWLFIMLLLVFVVLAMNK